MNRGQGTGDKGQEPRDWGTRGLGDWETPVNDWRCPGRTHPRSCYSGRMRSIPVPQGEDGATLPWVALVGPEVEENLSLRHLASSLAAAGFPSEIVPFNAWSEFSGVAGKIPRATERPPWWPSPCPSSGEPRTSWPWP